MAAIRCTCIQSTFCDSQQSRRVRSTTPTLYNTGRSLLVGPLNRDERPCVSGWLLEMVYLCEQIYNYTGIRASMLSCMHTRIHTNKNLHYYHLRKKQ